MCLGGGALSPAFNSNPNFLGACSKAGQQRASLSRVDKDIEKEGRDMDKDIDHEEG
jgi:hypothetical protein